MGVKGLCRRYSNEEIERALHELARVGRPTVVAENLGIPRETLTTWKLSTHADRYQEIAKEVMPQVHAAAASEMEDVIRHAAVVELKALGRMEEQLDAGTAKDPSTLGRNASVMKGVNLQHLGPMRDKPQVIEHRHIHEVLTELETRVPRLKRADVESTAIEDDAA